MKVVIPPVALIDTTVFCNLIPVPRRDQDRVDVLDQLQEYIEIGATLLLPMAAVMETGNHIAQLADGRVRRSTAKAFCEQVCQAIDGVSPWTPTPFWDVDALRAWLVEFPDQAMKEVGMADLSIIKAWERQCDLHKKRRVFIWSLDAHLLGYDRKP